MLNIIKDTLLDAIKIIPFLFVAFLLIEYFEHKLTDKNKEVISKSGKLSTFFGSLLGLIPQCGFSIVATNLYVTRIISLGTLVAIYLSTSDEMLPIMISKNAPWNTILYILLIKFIVGLIAGYIIDFLLRKRKKETTYDICHDEHCGCEHSHSLIKSSLIHTLKTILYILIITFILNVIFEYLGIHYLSKLLQKDTLVAPLITSLIGLIPNCGASIMITELYLNGAISFAATISGLLTGSGISLIVLFKSNKSLKENLFILLLLYFIGTIIGIIIELITLVL